MWLLSDHFSSSDSAMAGHECVTLSPIKILLFLEKQAATKTAFYIFIHSSHMRLCPFKDVKHHVTNGSVRLSVTHRSSMQWLPVDISLLVASPMTLPVALSGLFSRKEAHICLAHLAFKHSSHWQFLKRGQRDWGQNPGSN